jgi:hypothetical protein
MVSLDDFLEQAEGISSVSFVKVDVQGFELSVCKGMTRTLIQNPDVILMIELSRNDLRYFGVEAQDMLEYLRSRFSHVYGIRRSGTLMSVTFETLERSLVDERTPAYTDILLANRPLQ